MKVIDFGEKSCQTVQRYLDSYLNNELLVETNHEVLHHLENCSSCSAELESRRRVRSVLRKAVHEQTAPAGLQTRIQAALRRPSRPVFPRWAMAVAAALVLVALGLGSLRLRNEWVSTHELVARILGVGVENHVNCTLAGHYPNTPPTVEQMIARLGEDYAALLPIIQAKFDGYTILQGHRCTTNRRRHVHVTMRKDDTFLSVVLVRKQTGESFPKNMLVKTLDASGVAVHEGSMEKLQVSGFETRDHLAFVVSNLPTEANRDYMARVAQPVRELLARLEI